ncbi:10356_t:CDS:2, partial [Paraglomus occultum]
ISFSHNRTLISMAYLVSTIEAFLIEEPLDSLCGASAVYLAIENNNLPPFEYVRGVIDRAVNSSLLKIEDIERKTKALEVLSQVAPCIGSGCESLRDTRQTLENVDVSNLTWRDPKRVWLLATTHSCGEIWHNPAFMTSTSRSEGTYVTDVIIPLLRSSLGGDIVCLSTAERQSLASKARRSIRLDEERMGKKPDIMGLLKRDEKIL